MEWYRIFKTAAEARDRIKEDVPQLIILDGIRICLVLHDGVFRAVQDACSHNGQSLSKGKVNYLGEIVCPWHGYRFDLGTGRPCDSSSPDLKIYPVKTDDTGFYIGVP